MKKGFTLIELLVVIAIIGILAVIIILNLASASEKSKYAKAKSELKVIDSAATLAYLDGFVENVQNPTTFKALIESSGVTDASHYSVNNLKDSAGTPLILNAPEVPSGSDWGFGSNGYYIRLNGTSDHQAALHTPNGWCVFQSGGPIERADLGVARDILEDNCSY